MQTEPALPRRRRRIEETRTRLLDAALAVFLEDGYDGTTTGRITERADLGAGTFYLHFKDKRGIYEAVVRRRLDGLRRQYADALRKQKRSGPDAEIALLIEVVLARLLDHQAVAKLVLLDGPPLERWLLDEMGREMAGVLGDGVAAPELVAHMVIGATLNAGRRALVRPRASTAKALADDVVRFCTAGVAAATTGRTTGRPKRRS